MRPYPGVFLVGLVLLLGSTLHAGAPEKIPRKTKLPAPVNVTCTVAAGEVRVGWDAIPDAASYQVESVGTLTDGIVDKESDFAAAPPYVIATEEYTALIVHVRALPPPKKEGKPQSAAPKGVWSLPCAAVVPVP